MYARELLFFMGVPLCGGLVADGEALPLVLGILKFVYEGDRIVLEGNTAITLCVVRIGAWSGLPIEAVCVWIAVTYATAIVFEVVKLWQASERPAKDAFFGLK